MDHLKHIGIGVDLSNMDELLFQHVKFIAQTSHSEDIYLISVLKDFPSDIVKEFPNIEAERKKEVETALKEKIAANFPVDFPAKVHAIVKSGAIAKSMLQISHQKHLDLIVIGKRYKSKNGGLLAQRLARRANCNLLIIPEGAKPKVDRLLVPIDFSRNSELALKRAIAVALKTNKDAEIFCQNVYTVPTGYHYSGKTYEEFSEIMQKNAQRDFEKFMKKIDTQGIKITDIYSLDTNEDKTTDIIDAAKKHKVDGIFVGAKGLTSSTALFLGSNTEKLIQKDTKFPLTIIRKKGDNKGILDFLKEL